MTFNVKGFGSTNRYRNLKTSKKILEFTKGINPDIICFQEFSRFEFKSFAYYPHKFVGYRQGFEKTLQVIYSKNPIINKGYIDFPDTRNQCIYADIKIKDNVIRVYNIHLQSYMLRVNRSNLTYKGSKRISNKINIAQNKQEEQVKIVLDHASKFDGTIVFSGDFNSTQYSKIYKQLKYNKQDSFIEAGFGFGATYPLFNYPFRIDYVLTGDNIKILSHQNFDLKLSDHEPVLVKMKLN